MSQASSTRDKGYFAAFASGSFSFVQALFLLVFVTLASNLAYAEQYTIVIKDSNGQPVPVVNVVGTQRYEDFTNSQGKVVVSTADYDGALNLVFTHLEAGLVFEPAQLTPNLTDCPGHICNVLATDSDASNPPTVALQVELYQGHVLVPDSEVGVWGATNTCPATTNEDGIAVFAVSHRPNGCNDNDADPNNDYLTLYGHKDSCSFTTPYQQLKMKVCPGQEFNRVVMDQSCTTPPATYNGYRLKVQNVLNGRGVGGVNFRFNMGVNDVLASTQTDFQGVFRLYPASHSLDPHATYTAVPTMPGYIFYPPVVSLTPGANPQNNYTIHAIPSSLGQGAVVVKTMDGENPLPAVELTPSSYFSCGSSQSLITDASGEVVFPILRQQNCSDQNGSSYDDPLKITTAHPTCVSPHDQDPLAVCSGETLSESVIPFDCSVNPNAPIQFSGIVYKPDGTRFSGVDIYDSGEKVATSDEDGIWSYYTEREQTRVFEAHNSAEGYVFDPLRVAYVSANRNHSDLDFHALLRTGVNPPPAAPPCEVKAEITVYGTIFNKGGSRKSGAEIFYNHEKITTSDFNGNYSFTMPAFAEGWVTVDEENDLVFYDYAGVAIVQEACDVFNVDFRETEVEPILLSGTAYHWDYYNDKLGPPHANVDITAFVGEQRLKRETKTRSDGTYMISVPMDEVYDIFAAKEGYSISPQSHTGEADIHQYDLDFITYPIGTPICGNGDDTDSDGDGTPDCYDLCDSDPNKLHPGACGCGVPDTDSDGDGSLNCQELCDEDPLKLAPGVCGCGIRDVDSDGDGHPDCMDECPLDFTKQSVGVCGCGVADIDTDGDGTYDCNDECKLDPNKNLVGSCGCGVYDTDSDGDGTADCIDLCVNDSTKIEPGTCGCGNPDTDTDGDGTPDCIDQCQDDAGKSEPGECGCGVADTDSDGDGVLDCFDLCPADLYKIEQGQCGCGLPDEDKNGNGIPDCEEDSISGYGLCELFVPSPDPTPGPTANPTSNPTAEPTSNPTTEPTSNPTTNPTGNPTANPTTEPTASPTVAPTPDPDPPKDPGKGKVEICHIPPGNEGNAHTIKVAQAALPAHLGHGDTLGACPDPGKSPKKGKNSSLFRVETATYAEGELNWWVVKNEFSQPVTVDLKLEGADWVSQLDMSGYEEIIVSTPSILDGPNILILSVDGKEINRIESRVRSCEYEPPLEELSLISKCSEAPEATSRWELRNPYPYSLNLNWTIQGTEHSGSVSIDAGGLVTFSTPNGSNPSATIEIDYYGNSLFLVDSEGERCPYPPVNASITGECLTDVRQQYLRWTLQNAPVSALQAQNLTGTWTAVGSNPLETGSIAINGQGTQTIETTRQAGVDELRVQFDTEDELRSVVHQELLCDDILKPIVLSVCSPNPGLTQNWLVENTRPDTRTYTYNIGGSEQSGTITLNPSEKREFSTVTTSDGFADVLTIMEEGVVMGQVSSLNENCEAPKPKPTATPTPVPPGCNIVTDNGPALWRASLNHFDKELRGDSSNGHIAGDIAVWEYKDPSIAERMVMVYDFSKDRMRALYYSQLGAQHINGSIALNSTPYANVLGGRRVIYEGAASNLTYYDSNEAWDVFIFDADTLETRNLNPNAERVSNGGSSSGQISKSGNYAAFFYYPQKDVTAERDLVLYDWENDESRSILGGAIKGHLDLISISDEYVLYLKSDESTSELSLYEYSIADEASTLRGLNVFGRTLDSVRVASMSEDNRFVAYIGMDPSIREESLFVYDRRTDSVLDVRSIAGEQSDLLLGRFIDVANTGEVVFTSASSLFDSQDRNAVRDTFILNPFEYSVVRIVDRRGVGFMKPTDYPHITSDGRFVAFQENVGVRSDARLGYSEKIFLLGSLESAVQYVTANAEGGVANSGYNTLRGLHQGRVVFDSAATNLLAGDGNGALDVYISRPVDLCPCDRFKIYPGACGCGIPDFDDDGDGIAECKDPTFNVVVPPKVEELPTIADSCSVTKDFLRIWTLSNPYDSEISVQWRIRGATAEGELAIPANSTARLGTQYQDLSPYQLELYYQGRLVDRQTLSDKSCIGPDKYPFVNSSCLVSGPEAEANGYEEAIKYQIINPSSDFIKVAWLEEGSGENGIHIIKPNSHEFVYVDAVRERTNMMRLYFDDILVDTERASFVACTAPPAADVCSTGATEHFTYKSGAGALASAMDPSKALGLPQFDKSANYTSLGQNGSIDLGFEGKAVYDGEGYDFYVADSSTGGWGLCENGEATAEVWVTMDRVFWKRAAEICGSGYVDIGSTGYRYAIAVRIVDKSGNGEGYDLDGLGCDLPPVVAEPTPTPTPEALCRLSGDLTGRKGNLKKKDIKRFKKINKRQQIMLRIRNEQTLETWELPMEEPYTWTKGDLPQGTYDIRILDNDYVKVKSRPIVFRGVELNEQNGTCNQGGVRFALGATKGRKKKKKKKKKN